MCLDSSLPDLCHAGITGDEPTWRGELTRLRAGLQGRTCSCADAGRLGVLLMMAGRGLRALEVFRLLEDFEHRDPRGETSEATGETESGSEPAVAPSRPPSSPAAELFDSATGPMWHHESPLRLLAALVLSGRWGQARWCCERIVRSERDGAGKERVGCRPNSFF